MEFNQRLRDLRQDKDLSQAKLGEILNIQQAAISKYELGTLEPNLQMIIKICDFFQVTTDYLLGLSTNPKKGRFDEQE